MWKKYIFHSVVYLQVSIYICQFMWADMSISYRYVHIAAHMRYNVPSSLIEPILCYIQSVQSVFICTIDSCFLWKSLCAFHSRASFDIFII